MKKVTLLGSILIFFMLIFTIFTPTVSSELFEKNNDIPEGLWFIVGFFKYLDEDENNIFLRVIHAKLTGVGNGFMFYKLRFPI